MIPSKIASSHPPGENKRGELKWQNVTIHHGLLGAFYSLMASHTFTDHDCVLFIDLVIEKANLKDVFHVLHPISHGQVSQRVSQQYYIRTRPQLLEMAGVEQCTFPFIVDVDQLSLESPQHSLYQQMKRVKYCFKPWCGDETVVCGVTTYRFIKVHVVGEDFDVGVEDPGLANHLFEDVSYPSREDEERDAVLMQVVKEELVALPVKTSTHC